LPYLPSAGLGVAGGAIAFENGLPVGFGGISTPRARSASVRVGITGGRMLIRKKVL
jgi:hypothetical protein